MTKRYARFLEHSPEILESKVSAARNASLMTISPGISNESSTVEMVGIVDVLPATQTNMVSGSTVSPPIVPFLPMSAMATMNKFPGGMQGALLSLLIESESLDVKSLTQLMVSLAPHLPSLLKGILKTNTSGLTHADKMCYEDMDAFLNGAMLAKMWAIGMLDASGKPGPALMKGATKFYGNFDECLESVSDVSPVTGRAVRGDTCVVSLTPPLQLTALQEDIPDSLLSLVTLDWHLCVPDTCSGQSIRAGLESGLSQLNINITQVICHSEVKTGPLNNNPAGIGAIVVIVLLGFLVFLGTILDMNIRVTKDRRGKEATTVGPDVVKQHDMCRQLKAKEKAAQPPVPNGKIPGNVLVNNVVDKEKHDLEKHQTGNPSETNGDTHHISNGGDVTSKTAATAKQTNVHQAPFWQKLLLCFSAVSNGEKILSVQNTPGSLTCLNGVRVLSMGWVILGHTSSLVVRIADNPVTAVKLIQRLPFQVIINGTLSVDSFFVMSGLLVTYLFLRETEKKGGVRVKQMVLYYVHRFWRLTPAYAFVIYVNTYLVRYFTDGPTWSGAIDQKACERDWWLTLLYVNNLVRDESLCIGWGWFLANDMQFYIVAPLALIPLALGVRRGFGVYMRVFGLCVVAGFIITSIATTAYFIHDTNSDLFHNKQRFVKVYIKPWCRVGTFAIGMAVGYILHTTKIKIKMSTFLQGVGWFLALVAAGAITLSTYDENGPGRSAWGVGGMTAHETLFRPVWGLVLGWVILMCCSGKAGIINCMLSWAWWQPLARLTYGTFLIHPIILSLDNVGASTKLIHFTTANLVNRFFGYTCLSYIMAFLLAILVEAPLLQIEKLLLSK